MIGVLSGPEMKAQLGLIVTRQVRLQGITVGHRDGFEAMCRGIQASGIKPVVDRVLPFDKLLEEMELLPQGRHFGKICLNSELSGSLSWDGCFRNRAAMENVTGSRARKRSVRS